MHGGKLRVYHSTDLIGVEIGGAVKNVMAIAVGICDGLGLGQNARAALITRGLAELSRLGVALGANPLTFLGMAGVGDLVLTCTGDLSRNRTLGMKVAAGFDPEAFGAAVGAVRGGGRVVLLTPPLARWPDFVDPEHLRIAVHPYGAADVSGRYLRRLVALVRADSALRLVTEGTALPAPEPLAPAAVSANGPCRGADQAAAVAAGTLANAAASASSTALAFEAAIATGLSAAMSGGLGAAVGGAAGSIASLFG